jgi:hypothetical protein
VTIEGKDEPKDALERMCEALLTLVQPTPEAVTAVVQETLGPGAKVQLAPAATG